ncbi:MAG: Flp family type IVb pilin [Bacillota bacterium]|nr:Flp family type IVb pilin [Bacillota bacterium]
MDGWRKEDGQGTVEYAFILMVVAFVLLAGFGLLGDTVSAFFQATGNLLQSLLP